MKRYECADIAALLSGLLDGELDDATRHQAEVHLTDCADCRKTIQDAEQLDRRTSALMEAYESRGTGQLEQRVLHAIRDDGAPVPVVIPFRPRERRLAIVAVGGWLSAAAALVVAAVSIFQGPATSASGGGALVANDTDVTSPGVFKDDAPNLDPEKSTNETIADNQVAANTTVPEKDTTEETTAVVVVNENAVPGGDDRVALNNDAEEVGDDTPAPFENAVAMATVVEPYSAMKHAVAMASTLDAEIKAQRLARAETARHIEDERLAEIRRDAERQARADERLARAAEKEVDPYSLSHTLHQAATILHVLQEADAENYNDINLIREVLESDDLVDRLAEVRNDLGYDAEPEEIVNRAWTALEWVSGAIDSDDIRMMQQAIEASNLPARLEDLSDQYVD